MYIKSNEYGDFTTVLDIGQVITVKINSGANGSIDCKAKVLEYLSTDWRNREEWYKCSLDSGEIRYVAEPITI